MTSFDAKCCTVSMRNVVLSLLLVSMCISISLVIGLMRYLKNRHAVFIFE